MKTINSTYYLAGAIMLLLGGAVSCGPTKLQTLQRSQTQASLVLPKESEIPELEYHAAKKDTVVFHDKETGKDLILMKAVKDELTGDMVANEVLDAAIVTARFRNIAERRGKVDLQFQVIVPAAMQDSKWQLRFYPDMFNIYQSLMMRFDEVSDRGNMFNQDTLEQLAEHTEMIGYSLHSLKFELEGVRIPAFMGSITVRIHGAQTMCNFAKLLFEFGNYAGVGIKTAMGMGSVHITERRRNAHDRTGSEAGSGRATA